MAFSTSWMQLRTSQPIPEALGLIVAPEITNGLGDTEVWERYSPGDGREHDIGIKGRTSDGELDGEEGGDNDREEEDIGKDDFLLRFHQAEVIRW